MTYYCTGWLDFQPTPGNTIEDLWDDRQCSFIASGTFFIESDGEISDHNIDLTTIRCDEHDTTPRDLHDFDSAILDTINDRFFTCTDCTDDDLWSAIVFLTADELAIHQNDHDLETPAPEPPATATTDRPTDLHRFPHPTLTTELKEHITHFFLQYQDNRAALVDPNRQRGPYWVDINTSQRDVQRWLEGAYRGWFWIANNDPCLRALPSPIHERWAS